MDYDKKHLKYKKKYFNLKNLKGGAGEICDNNKPHGHELIPKTNIIYTIVILQYFCTKFKK